MYFGEDGLIHIDGYAHPGLRCQVITIPLPLARVLSIRCVECGTAKDYEEATKRLILSGQNVYPDQIEQRLGLI